MDFETLAVAKSYTNQQILNNNQENSDEPLVLNMLDYGVDLGTILATIGEQVLWQGELTNVELLKEKVNKQESKEIILVLESDIIEELKLILPGSLYCFNDNFLISTKITIAEGIPFLYECTFIVASSGEAMAIKEDVIPRITYLLPSYAGTGEDEGKFLRIINDKPAWVSLDDVSEVGA